MANEFHGKNFSYFMIIHCKQHCFSFISVYCEHIENPSIISTSCRNTQNWARSFNKTTPLFSIGDMFLEPRLSVYKDRKTAICFRISSSTMFFTSTWRSKQRENSITQKNWTSLKQILYPKDKIVVKIRARSDLYLWSARR